MGFLTIAQTAPQHDLGERILLGVLFLDAINLSFWLFLVIKHPTELFITLRGFNPPASGQIPTGIIVFPSPYLASHTRARGTLVFVSSPQLSYSPLSMLGRF